MPTMLPEQPARPERTGWRDEELSLRHRYFWGTNCPAVDLDLVLVEFNFGRPAGIVEYKHHWADMPDLQHPTYRALTYLANIARIPFLLAFYWKSPWAFRVYPVNMLAKRYFTERQNLSELAYVSKLYQIRHFTIPAEVAAQLHTELPPTL